jgi:hypothetical protein
MNVRVQIKVRDVFTERFFARMQELYAANQQAIDPQPKKWHVDLFGMNAQGRECGFWEVKQPGEKRQPHQEYLLGFVRHLCDSEAMRVLKDPEFRVQTQFVRYGGPATKISVSFEDPATTTR